MSWNDEQDYDYDHGSSGRYGASHGGLKVHTKDDLQRQHQVGAERMAQRFAVKNGRIFGVPIPREITDDVNMLVDGAIRPWLLGAGGHAIHTKLYDWLTHHNVKNAGSWANRAAVAAGILIIGVDDIMGAYDVGNQWHKSMNRLVKENKEYLQKKHHGASVAGLLAAKKNNELFEVACDQQATIAKHDAGAVLAGVLPHLWMYKMLYDQRHTSAIDRAHALEKHKAEKAANAQAEALAKETDPTKRAQAKAAMMAEQAREHAQQKIRDQEAYQIYHDTIVKEMGANAPSTWEIRDSWQEMKREEARLLRDPEKKDGKTQNLGDYVVTMGGSVGAKLLKVKIDESKAAKTKDSLALDMITTMSRALHKDSEAHDIEGHSINEYVREIFQQHQRNRGEPIIGDRFEAKFGAIADEIARRIDERTMDPLALIDLVGERKVVHRGGKSFIKFDPEADEQGKKSPLTCLLDAEEKIFPGHRSENIKAAYDDAAFTREQFKAMVKSLSDPQYRKEHLFFTTLFSDEMLLDGGMKKETLETLRKEFLDDQKEVVAVFEQAVVDYAKQDDEALKKLNLKEQEIGALRELADRIEQGDEKAVLAELGKRGPKPHGAAAAIRNILIEKKDVGSWRERITKGQERLHQNAGISAEEKAAKAKEKVAELVGAEHATALAKGEEGGHSDRPLTGEDLGKMTPFEASVPETGEAGRPAGGHLQRVAAREGERAVAGHEVN